MISPSANPASATPVIDVIIESASWSHAPDAEPATRNAIREAAAFVALPQAAGIELAIVLTDDAAIQTLNRKWRGIDKPTNVLSFPATQPSAPDTPTLLGDIVIAYETVIREADAERKPVMHHLSHLVIHGFLHLLGYDHDKDDAAERMEGLERAIMARLGLSDPYMIHDARR